MKSFLILFVFGLTFAQPLPTGAMQAAPANYLDVPTSHWAADAVLRLTDLGILTGYPDGLFKGERTASRYELAVLAARILDLSSSNLAKLAQDAHFRTEVKQVASDLERIYLLEERLSRLELGLENSASLAYAQSLEARISMLEATLNSFYGEQLFTVVPNTSVPQSAAQTVAPVPQVTFSNPVDLPTSTSPLATETQSNGRMPSPVISASDATNDATMDTIPDEPTETATAVNEPLLALPFSVGKANNDRYWFGLSTGFPLGATLHFGIHDIVSNADLRLSTSLGLGGAVDIGLNALLELPVTIADWPTQVYGGLGSTLTVGKDVGGLNVQGFLGLEYRLGDGLEPGGLFVELGPILETIPELDSSFVWKLGFNYHY